LKNSAKALKLGKEGDLKVWWGGDPEWVSGDLDPNDCTTRWMKVHICWNLRPHSCTYYGALLFIVIACSVVC
jgi:hypothetical protein